jgi:hypothetical protein
LQASGAGVLGGPLAFREHRPSYISLSLEIQAALPRIPTGRTINATPLRALVASRHEAAFLTHRAHQPVGAISPSTSLQPFGAMKKLQPSHWWSSFGLV